MSDQMIILGKDKAPKYVIKDCEVYDVLNCEHEFVNNTCLYCHIPKSQLIIKE